jgi:hypothetical protein
LIFFDDYYYITAEFLFVGTILKEGEDKILLDYI